MDNVGRLISVNSVMSFVAVHFLIVFGMKKWAIKKIDKIRRAFCGRDHKMQVETIALLRGRR
jgi:hypothetical protein